MSSQLYQEIILKRSAAQVRKYKPDNALASAQVKNPLCGDEVTVYLASGEARRLKFSYEGYGCAICLSSADLMAESAETVPAEELLNHLNQFLEHMEQDAPLPATVAGIFSEDFQAVAKVKEFPSRIKCATLPWQAALEALKGIES